MTPALACAVLSYRDEPFLVEAVRSLLSQDMPVEVVVVNSGGGNPGERLSNAGIDVAVHSVPHRLYPGAVRNIGIDRTVAPFMAFLAADCLAEPGWVAARLRAHHDGAAAVASVPTNANPHSLAAWASLLLLHNRRLAVTKPAVRLHYSLSYDRSLFQRFGRFREDLRAGEDTEFNARFAGKARLVLAPDAVTAHRYPDSPGAMLRDAYRRGGLQARSQGALEGRGPRHIKVALRGPRNVIRSVVVAARSPAPVRGTLLRACPLALAAGVAYTAGALTASSGAVED
jgi:glycosyltransferase involved in cell wall biosynthesis